MSNLQQEPGNAMGIDSEYPENDQRSELKENDSLIDSLTRGYNSKTSQLNARIAKQTTSNVFLSLAVVALTTAVVYFAAFNTTDPYVLEVDKNGNVTYGGPLTNTMELGDRNTAPELQEFIEHWRWVTPDNIMQKRNITRLYCMVPGGSATEKKLNGYFTSGANDPFVKNQTKSVATRIRQVSKLDGSTWQVEWYETTRNHDGTLIDADVLMKATLIVEKDT
ncbi:VirB8/TrbF family protein, partial [Maritalea sp.]|uniref:VirB8/TrbF family protein n=1 Tax=Maritalea sp. TaxID=2003361 RepID=UPI003EF8617B